MDGQGEQGALVVIPGDAVEVHDFAGFAAVHEHPLAVLAKGNGDGFHKRTAVGLAVAGSVIEVHAPQAPWAVIAVLGAGCVETELKSAVAAFQIV